MTYDHSSKKNAFTVNHHQPSFNSLVQPSFDEETTDQQTDKDSVFPDRGNLASSATFSKERQFNSAHLTASDHNISLSPHEDFDVSKISVYARTNNPLSYASILNTKPLNLQRKSSESSHNQACSCPMCTNSNNSLIQAQFLTNASLIQKEDETEGDSDKKFSMGDSFKALFGVGKTITIGKEKVVVYSEAEEEQAPKLIQEIKDKYGIEISSVATVEAIKKQYNKVPEKVKNSLETYEWEFKELAAVARALAHYAPILGENRAKSSKKDQDQEVISIGKVKQAIDSNSSTGALDTSTLGEYFQGSKNFGMFKAGTNCTTDFPDNNKQLEATAVHEMAHGLMADQYNNFVASGSDGYWLDQATKSGKSGAEIPPTNYGKKNAREDLCESVMYYFVEPSTLQSKCPKRYAFIDAAVKGWSPDAKKEAEAIVETE